MTQIQGSQAVITLGNQTLTADLKGPQLKPGPLEVEVKQTHPSLVLTVPPKAPQNLQSEVLNSQQAALQNQYKQLLANQQPITQVLQQLQNAPNLSQNIQTVIGQLLEQLLKPGANLNGQRLKEALSNSGLLLENKLLKADSGNLANDTKAQLLRLQQLIKQEPPASPNASLLAHLGKALAEGINKITLQQLQSFEHPELVNLELPFQQQGEIKPIQVGIYQKRYPQQTLWEILVELEINQSDSLFKLTLNESKETLYCSIWCETSSLEAAIQTKLPILIEQLQTLGLHVPPPQILPQKPKQSDFATRVALIDIKV
ncbi:hypothetical protein [Thiomicrorhabdus cannonii]|uniref:hypothetical protein n=1 Tax=Thiomicrorhabdus cannonii TaxID=2748011 RepID=UPI0015BB4D9A|nr:hypothetical protein [Thiomicrorhabdus cannonii]